MQLPSGSPCAVPRSDLAKPTTWGMENVQALVRHNDENVGARLAGLKEQGADRGSTTTRKPFGLPSKARDGEATLKRRAFGDITNSSVRPSLLQPSAGKPFAPGVRDSNTNATGQAAQTGPHKESAKNQSQAFAGVIAGIQLGVAGDAELEVERPAGKTWAQQEEDRARKADVEVDRVASTVLQSLCAWPLTSWVSYCRNPRSSEAHHITRMFKRN